MFELNQYLENPVIWLIILVSLASYGLLLELLIADKSKPATLEKCINWRSSLQILLTALPLLGLLGTVAGLLDTFRQMSQGNLDQQALLSSGIADAMLTTEMGLVLVVPGWILAGLSDYQISQAREANQCAPS